jgi:hypothetical protein
MPLDAAATLDSTTWAALALVLTVVGGALSWVAWRRRGAAAGLRGLAWSLLPVAAWLTGTLRLAVEILDDVVRWATRLVFSPSVWLGVVVAGVAVALWVLSGVLRARGIGVREKAGTGELPSRQGTPREKQAPKQASKRSQPPVDDDMAEIEAILKRHGI